MIAALARATPLSQDTLMAIKRPAARATGLSASLASAPWGTALLL